MITAESLLAINDRDKRRVEIRGGEVYVRSLTVSEYYVMEAANKLAAGDPQKLTINQLAAYVCNENGEPVLSLEQAEQFLDKRHPETVKKIIEAAMDLNGYGKDSRENISGNS